MTTPSMPERTAAIRRFRWIAVILPVIVFAVIAVAQTALLPHLPDPVAIHWGMTGGPDGFGPAWTYPVMTLLIGGGLAALLGGLTVLEVSRSGTRGSSRLMPAIVWWMTGMLGLTMLSLVIVQVGLDDAADAPSTTWVMLAGAALGVVLAVVAHRLTPHLPHAPEGGMVPEPVRLAPTERAVWLRTVTMGRRGGIVLGVAVAVLVALTCVTALGDLALGGRLSGGTWILAGCTVLVAVLVLIGCVFRVRVDDTGLTVRAPIGWPRIHIPRGEIRSAEAVTVNPLSEYGGWGWRYGAGGWGVVMRAGAALRVTRANGRVFTVTVDDAETAAALLRGLSERERKA